MSRFPITSKILKFLDALTPLVTGAILLYFVYQAWAYFFPHAAEILNNI